jgi:hypothetical protein
VNAEVAEKLAELEFSMLLALAEMTPDVRAYAMNLVREEQGGDRPRDH